MREVLDDSDRPLTPLRKDTDDVAAAARSRGPAIDVERDDR